MPRMTVEEYSRLTKHFAPVEVLTYDYPDGFEITPEYGVIARKDLGGGRAVDIVRILNGYRLLVGPIDDEGYEDLW